MSTRVSLAVGLAICVLAAALMILDVVGVPWGAVIGVIGVGVISASSVAQGRNTGSA